MTFKEAVHYFVICHTCFSDYWFMQECWETWKDALARNHQITEKQRCNCGNPCTPDTFKRWCKKWYGLRSESCTV